MKQPANLDIYRAKRNFSRTREPRGKRTAKRGHPIFVVQKHDARRLHFDFRIELDGVLLSWAVTRGPSLDPDDKRLAVRTENHPTEYGGFEGTIPGGQYGGGTVMIWDRGTWEPDGDPHDGLERGDLKFTLNGNRLKGRFVLVRMRNRRGEKRENWLLIKKRDDEAVDGRDGISHWTTSVVTGRTMKEIAADMGRPVKAAQLRVPAEPAKHAKAAKLRTSTLEHVPPQLATRATTPPEGKDWLHEVKYDGYRIMAAIAPPEVKLYSRTGGDWTKRFGNVTRALAEIPVASAKLDGEVVVLDENGKSDFGALQQALKGSKGNYTYCVFDLLELDGHDLRAKPLIERKRRLKRVLDRVTGGPITYSDHVVGDGSQVFAGASRLGLEGIISKKADGVYQSRRTQGWVKAKCLGREDHLIVGYRPSDKKGRPFASLLLAEDVGGDLKYRGRVGTGFDIEGSDRLAKLLHALKRKDPPLRGVPAEMARGVVWVEPKLEAELAFSERTSAGVLRHPVFLGLREDKMKGGKNSSRVSGGEHEATAETAKAPVLTHPAKVLFGTAGITKRELVDYLLRVAPLMLPHIRDRPLSLFRCPDGTDGQGFFQKHDMRGFPAAFRRVSLEESDGEEQTYLSIANVDGLVAAAQMAVLELHVWGSKVSAIERPDRLVLDLDPDPSVQFPAVRDAAEDLRDLLAKLNLKSFPMVTGGKGIHVVAPLTGDHGWDDLKNFTRAIAHYVTEREPMRFTATMAKSKRRGKIFLDWLRNERGSTAIAPYSPRAKGQATIAMPVTWAELKRLTRADAFTIGSVQKDRMRRDPWPDYFKLRQSISRLATKLEGKQ